MGESGFYKSFRDQLDYARQQIQAQQAQMQQQEQMNNLVPLGSPAPDFRQPTPDGRDLALSDLRGKVVLVDFWASWCKPCRAENPNLVAAYKKYHAKGFEILSVSLDREKTSWTMAIQQDGLLWKNHVSDLQFWNNAAAKEYGVSSIPYSVLVDREGRVIDKNLRGPALEQKLAQVLGS
jgi:thiol-disulfide isomerase/thioredoxin